jgi:hypothetical protein
MKKYKEQHIEDSMIHELHLDYFKEEVNKLMKRWKVTKQEAKEIFKELIK